MNKERRNSINEVITKLGEIKTLVEALRDEEQESLDNLPDNLQYSICAERMQEAIENLDYANDSIEEVADYLEEAQHC